MKKIAHFRRAVWHSDDEHELSKIIECCFSGESNPGLIPTFPLKESEQCLGNCSPPSLNRGLPEGN